MGAHTNNNTKSPTTSNYLTSFSVVSAPHSRFLILRNVLHSLRSDVSAVNILMVSQYMTSFTWTLAAASGSPFIDSTQQIASAFVRCARIQLMADSELQKNKIERKWNVESNTCCASVWLTFESSWGAGALTLYVSSSSSGSSSSIWENNGDIPRVLHHVDP